MPYSHGTLIWFHSYFLFVCCECSNKTFLLSILIPLRHQVDNVECRKDDPGPREWHGWSSLHWVSYSKPPESDYRWWGKAATIHLINCWPISLSQQNPLFCPGSCIWVSANAGADHRRVFRCWSRCTSCRAQPCHFTYPIYAPCSRSSGIKGRTNIVTTSYVSPEMRALDMLPKKLGSRLWMRSGLILELIVVCHQSNWWYSWERRQGQFLLT